MSTWNGVGTIMYDWQHRPDGTAHATNWFVIGFLPVVPPGRRHLRVLSGDVAKGAWSMQYESLGSVPLEIAGVLRTYAKAYLFLPFILLAPPIAGVAAFLYLFKASLPLKEPTWPALGGVAILVYWAVVVSLILDRAFGRTHQKHAVD